MNTRIAKPIAVSQPAPPPTSNSPVFVPPARKVLSPGEWARAVSGFDAPFGFDRMPTVFG